MTTEITLHPTKTTGAELRRTVRVIRGYMRRSKARRALRDRSETAVGILQAQQEATIDGILVIGNDGRILSMNRRFQELWDFPPEVLQFKHRDGLMPLALQRVRDPEIFRTLVDQINTASEQIRTDDRVELIDGRVLSRTTVPVRTNGEVVGRAWYFRDITEYVESDRLRESLFRITEISRSARDLDELFTSLHNIVGELMDATNFYIALQDDKGMLSFPIFIDEMDVPPLGTYVVSGLTGWVLRTGQPLLANPKTVEDMVARGEIEDIGAPSVDWLGVPLRSGTKSIGALVVQSYRESVRYSERDKEILMFVSQHVANAIEQKAREEALRESEIRYRQMFWNNQAVKLVIDPETGAIVDANPAACGFYGYTEDELRMRSIVEINVQEPNQVQEALSTAATQMQGYFNFRHRLASGEVRDVEVYSGPIEVKGRKLLYSIIHDVTERKRAEKGLRRSEEHFRSLIENASDMIAIVDVQGTIHYSSPSVNRVLGYDPKKTIGSNIFDFAHPEDAPAAARALTEAFESQTVSQAVEIRVRQRDGSWKFLDGLAHRLEADSSERLVVNCRDVTERKLAEQALLTHSAAMEASMDGIAILNEKGDFTYVNHAFLKLFGYRNRHDVLGQSFALLHHRRKLPEVIRKIIPAFLSNGEWRGVSTGRTRDGRTVPVEVSLTRIGAGSAVCVVRDITERTLAEEQITHLAYHDALTGLPNRLLFKDRLDVAISHAQRDKEKLAVLFLDLDRFKIINDSLGHDAGDYLLQEVARRISACVRESDTVSRLGGDEFTVLLPALRSADDAARVARKILESLREPVEIQERPYYVTTSIGIALFPDDGSQGEALLKNADTAMYQAKEHGRNNYQLFNALINAKAEERLELESGLRRALVAQEFILHYQPIVRAQNGHIHGFEALIRWNDPNVSGLVPPGTFIPIAEASGLMQQIGEWVLDVACSQVQEWQKRGFTNLSLAVNLSVSQLHHRSLVQRIRETLERTGMPPHLLEMEITESSAMQNPIANIAVLQELKNLGIRISLDDFGIGHSSLGHLKDLPIHTVKIDQSFIRDMTADDRTRGIVAAIIAMAHTMGMTVVAEGVELELQRAYLREKKCDLMQGYLFQRPLDATAFEEMLLKHARETGQWTIS
jgi:diguanylate cyclase (GGDEF)-like protein/PAS domain S-box-containing protein